MDFFGGMFTFAYASPMGLVTKIFLAAVAKPDSERLGNQIFLFDVEFSIGF